MPAQLSESVYDLHPGLRADFLNHCNSLYQIIDRKTGRRMRWGPLLERRSEQRRLLKEILDDLGKGGPCQWLIGKALAGVFANPGIEVMAVHAIKGADLVLEALAAEEEKRGTSS